MNDSHLSLRANLATGEIQLSEYCGVYICTPAITTSILGVTPIKVILENCKNPIELYCLSIQTREFKCLIKKFYAKGPTKLYLQNICEINSFSRKIQKHCVAPNPTLMLFI